MAIWLIVAVCAQFLFAVSTLVDKHIVVRAAHIGKPIVYAFYISILSGFVIVLVPFGVSIPSVLALVFAFFSAAAFVLAIFGLYSALRIARASDVAPVVGAISAIATIILAGLWIEGEVTTGLLVPLTLLVVGTAVISHFHFSRAAIGYTAVAGIAFGTSFFFAKLVFIEISFFDGFFWTRMMNVLIALSLLAFPSIRAAVLHGGKHSTRGAKGLVVGNKILGGLAAVLMAYAISLGPVSVVNALGGLQFVFLFLFAFFFAPRMPLFASDKTGTHGGWHTALGVILIVTGLAALYLV